MTTLVNSFEGGTNSTTITTGNSGGASGNAFDAVTIGTGATLQFSNTEAHESLLSCEVATSPTSSASYVTWSTSLGSQTQVWFRIYLYLTSISVETRFINVLSSGSEAASLRTGASGQIVSEDANFTGHASFTNPIPLNQWCRIEGYFIGNASTGAISASLYDSADSIVPTETHTNTGLNTTGTITQINFGEVTSTANIAAFYLDDIGVSTTGYLGPSNTAIVYSRQEPVQAKGNGLPPRGRIGSNPGSLPALLLLNNFDGGSNGVTVTSVNSGGTSGNIFQSVSVGSGATFAFSNSEWVSGTLAAQVSTGASSVQSYAAWTESAIGNQPVIWFRFNAYFPVNPGSVATVLSAGIGNGVTSCASMQVTTSGNLKLLNSGGATILTSVNSIPLGNWFRVEGFIVGSANAGQVSFSLFSSPNAQVPIETQTSAATQHTYGSVNRVEFGLCNFTINNGPFYLDSIGVSNTGYIGPVSYTADPSTGMPGTVTRPRPQQPVRGRVIRGQVLSSFIFPLPVKFRTGSAYTQWATADPWTQWQTGSPYLDWETEEVS